MYVCGVGGGDVYVCGVGGGDVYVCGGGGGVCWSVYMCMCVHVAPTKKPTRAPA